MPIVTNPSPSNLSHEQILQRAFNESTDKLRTDASVTGSFTGELNVEVDAADGDNIAISSTDGTKKATLTTISSSTGLDVNVLNQLTTTASGLSKNIKSRKLIITDIPTKVPFSPLADRNTMSVRIMGGNTVFFGSSDVSPDEGYPKFQYEEIIADIKDNTMVGLWAICSPGQSSEIRIMEIA